MVSMEHLSRKAKSACTNYTVGKSLLLIFGSSNINPKEYLCHNSLHLTQNIHGIAAHEMKQSFWVTLTANNCKSPRRSQKTTVCQRRALFRMLSHTWVRYPGFWGHAVKCPILTTVVPGFPAIWLAVPFGANGAHLGICTLPEKIFFVCEISCFWVK